MKRVAIIGTGVAGTTIAHWIHQETPETSIVLFDAQDPLAASFGPTLLIHPFPGRSLAPHPNLGAAVEKMVKFLEHWRFVFPQHVRPCHMWRPMKGSNAQRLFQSWQDWWLPDGKHLHKNPWSDNLPYINLVSETEMGCVTSHQTGYDTLKTAPAYMVDGKELFSDIHQHFSERNITIIKDSIIKVQSQDQRWNLVGRENYDDFDQIVLAMGRGTQEWFPDLHLTLQGGSLVQVKPNNLKSVPALSLDGLHIGQHKSGDWVIGSTRWNTPPTETHTETLSLIQKLKCTLPNAPQMNTSSATVWSGIRTIFPTDRMPLCGRLPQHNNIFVVTALGSKGWLWGPWASFHLARLMNQPHHTIPPSIDLMRANAEDGWYCPKIV